MLRLLVLGLAVALEAAGIFSWSLGVRGPALYLIVSGALIVLGTLFERWRYRKVPPANAHWEPTGERFIDLQTGSNVEVLYDPDSGERRYQSCKPQI